MSFSKILIRISKFFNVSEYPVDNLMKHPENQVLLPITVDSGADNFIEIIPRKASVDYLKCYGNVEYIEKFARMKLQTISQQE